MNTSRELFLVDKQLEYRTRELEEYRFIGMNSLSPMSAMADGLDNDSVHYAMPDSFDGQPFSVGDVFEGRDKYLWVRKTVTLPAHRDDAEVYGLFRFGKTGAGHNSGFESLLYVDGEPWQGVDTNHNDVNFESLAGKTVTLTFMLWTGLEGGGPKKNLYHRFEQADIGYLHKDTDELYYLAKAIFKTVRLLEDEVPEKHALTAALDRALRRLDWDGDRFYDTVGDALSTLKDELACIPKKSDITVDVVGHTHIDVAWLWRLKHTREKAQRSFATVLRLMNEFDEYVFLQSQPQLYRYIQKDNPALFEKIRERVKDGRWEADGGMWLEADCNITSGEALTRQFLYGMRLIEKEFGHRCEYLWLPDVFGYSWALPQILRGVGINTFMTTKISWNQYDTMPHDMFRWRGIDGSEVMTYFITTPEIGRPLNDRFSTYNGMVSPRSVLGTWAKFHDKDLSNEVLLSYGYGDGGGGVNRNMLKMRRAMDQLPGLPNVRCERAGNFFKRRHADLDNTDRYVSTWDGELYLEYHRGTYTSQAKNKRANRKTEFALAECEWLNTIAYLTGMNYPCDELTSGWETVLRNQFHDIIPGSSITEVYEDSAKEYAQVNAMVSSNNALALERLVTPADDSWTLWHFGSFARSECVFIPETREGVFIDASGSVLPAQRVDNGYQVSVRIAPISLTTIHFTPGNSAMQTQAFVYSAATGTLKTPFYEVTFDAQGHISRLCDIENGREVLPAGALGNVLELYEDRPIGDENWNIDAYYRFKGEVLNANSAPEIIEQGALRMVLRFTYRFRHSSIIQDVIFRADNRRIDFVTKADWHESRRILKAAFPADVRTTQATYDIQYGHVQRPTHYNTSWDFARFEVVAHKWADISEQGYGVSLLNDCKYGHSTLDNVLRITLLKAGKFPDTQADMGQHEFTYALLPHAGTAAEGNTIEEATALNLAVHVVRGATNTIVPAFSIDTSGVCIDAIKKAEDSDDIILRIHECRGSHVRSVITPGFNMVAYAPCNLLEETTGEIMNGNNITASLKPFEIRTFRVTPARQG